MFMATSVFAHTVDVLAKFRRGENLLDEKGVDTTKKQATIHTLTRGGTCDQHVTGKSALPHGGRSMLVDVGGHYSDVVCSDEVY